MRDKKVIADYWVAHYTDPILLLCTLCGNTGIIDTRTTAVSHAGVNAGRLNFCLCPNGRHMRESGKSPEQFRP
jgi:hypothetical protein